MASAKWSKMLFIVESETLLSVSAEALPMMAVPECSVPSVMNFWIPMDNRLALVDNALKKLQPFPIRINWPSWKNATSKLPAMWKIHCAAQRELPISMALKKALQIHCCRFSTQEWKITDKSRKPSPANRPWKRPAPEQRADLVSPLSPS